MWAKKDIVGGRVEHCYEITRRLLMGEELRKHRDNLEELV